MDVLHVSKEDAVKCAQLIQVLNKAYFDHITMADSEAMQAVKNWVHDVATKMATQLQAKPEAPKPASEPEKPSFKIKAMGPLGSSKPARKKK